MDLGFFVCKECDTPMRLEKVELGRSDLNFIFYTSIEGGVLSIVPDRFSDDSSAEEGIEYNTYCPNDKCDRYLERVELYDHEVEFVSNLVDRSIYENFTIATLNKRPKKCTLKFDGAVEVGPVKMKKGGVV